MPLVRNWKYFLWKFPFTWKFGEFPQGTSELSRCLGIGGIPLVNFSRELGNYPDVWEFGEFSGEICQEKEFGNLQNSLRESEGSIFLKIRKFPYTWEFGEEPWEISQVPNFAIC